MFAISNERKGKFVVTTENALTTTSSPIISNALLIKTQVGTPNNSSISLKDTVKGTKYIQGEPIYSSSLTSIKKKIRFQLSKEAPVKKRKLKRQKEAKQKNKKTRNETYSIGRWKYDEHQRFVEALLKYGNDWKQVQKLVKTRSSTQARSHAQKFFAKIQRAKLLKFNLDLSKNSIKKLHDLVNNLAEEEYKKLLKAFNSVAFERKKPFKKNKKTSMSHSDEMSFFEAELFQEEENNTIIEYEDMAMIGRKRIRRASIEKDTGITQRRRRGLGSINSLEGFFNTFIEDNDIKAFRRESFDDRDYAISFNKAFNNEFANASKRKISQEDEIIYKSYDIKSGY